MPLLKFATEEQKAKCGPTGTLTRSRSLTVLHRYLPPIINGSHKVCFGVTEPNSGLDTLHLSTKAVRQGDKYIINGSKVCEYHRNLSLPLTTF